MVSEQPLVLYVCRGNTFRSAAAEAMHNHYARHSVALSAGISAQPNFAQHIEDIMKGKGTPLQKDRPTQLTDGMMDQAYKVIVFCSAEHVPKHYRESHSEKIEYWDLPKPDSRSDMKKTVDLVEQKVRELLAQVESTSQSAP